MTPKSLQNDRKVMPKSFNFDPNSIENMTSKSFQKQLPSLAVNFQTRFTSRSYIFTQDLKLS